MGISNPHHTIDPSRPLEGEVVLRETLSHRPALLCAAHGAYAPWGCCGIHLHRPPCIPSFYASPLLCDLTVAVCFVGRFDEILTRYLDLNISGGF